jgi:hypothetical protein
MANQLLQPNDSFIEMCEHLANETQFLIHKKPFFQNDAFVWTMPDFIPVDFTKPPPKKTQRLEVTFIGKAVDKEGNPTWILPFEKPEYRWKFSRAEYITVKWV